MIEYWPVFFIVLLVAAMVVLLADTVYGSRRR